MLRRVSALTRQIGKNFGSRPRGFHSISRSIASVCGAFVLVVSVAGCSPSPAPIVFTSDRDGNLEVYSVDPDGKNETNLTVSLDDEYSPVLSPSGS